LEPGSAEFEAAVERQIAATTAEFDAVDAEVFGVEPGLLPTAAGGGGVGGVDVDAQIRSMYDEFDAWWNDAPQPPRSDPDWRGFRVRSSSALA
jgi:hypothetical protein